MRRSFASQGTSTVLEYAMCEAAIGPDWFANRSRPERPLPPVFAAAIIHMTPEVLWALHEFFVGDPRRPDIMVTLEGRLCAHACFNHLEIPRLVTDPQELCDMLMAAMAAERLFDMA